MKTLSDRTVSASGLDDVYLGTMDIATLCMGRKPVRVLIKGDEVGVLQQVRDRMIRHLSTMLRAVMIKKLLLQSGTEVFFTLEEPTKEQELEYDSVYRF